MTEGAPTASGTSRATTTLRFSSLRRVVAVLEIAGGIIGLCLVLISMAQMGISGMPLSLALVLALMLLLFGLSVVAGLQLLRGRRIGYTLSIIVQILQLPAIVSEAIIYKVYALIRLIPFVQLREGRDLNINLGFDFNVLGVGFQIYLHNQVDGIILGLNVVPLLYIVLICLARPARAPMVGAAETVG